MAITNTLAGRNLGMILLGLWLILNGLLPLLSIRISSTATTGLAVLGIVAGILILRGRESPGINGSARQSEYELGVRHKIESLRNPLEDWRGRDGRGVFG